ncbi:MAG: hypothetical protein QM768_02855 [Agriterribacter sp.]
MISHCLNINEYHDIIRVNLLGGKKSGDYEYVHEIFESCHYWENKVIGYNYFLSLLLERLIKQYEISSDLIDKVYQIKEQANFDIQEFVEDFLEKLFTSNIYNPDITIEEMLIDFQNDLNG